MGVAFSLDHNKAIVKTSKTQGHEAGGDLACTQLSFDIDEGTLATREGSTKQARSLSLGVHLTGSVTKKSRSAVRKIPVGVPI